MNREEFFFRNFIKCLKMNEYIEGFIKCLNLKP